MVLVNVKEFDQHKFYLLTHKIKNTKFEVLDMPHKETQEYDHNDWKMMGSRYRDDERIARMVIGDIYAANNMNLEKAKKAFLAMSSVEIEPYIKKAVNESASADYWYTFEKEY